MKQTKFVADETNKVFGIYADAAATTPTDARVADLIRHLMTEEYGNAGSHTHAYGARAQQEVQLARRRLAVAAGANPDEIIFTSGATEANNLAILGLAQHGQATTRRHIVTTEIEHKAVLEPVAELEQRGFKVTRIAPDSKGHVAAADVLGAIRPDTVLVSVMHANNETGAVQPIDEIARELPSSGPFFHVDAAQSFGRLNAMLRHARIDLVSISGHKIFGPKGVGALITRRRDGQRLPIRPLMFGGGQEWGLRPGTLPVPLVAGFGLACELAERESAGRSARCLAMRMEALQALNALGAKVHADPSLGVLPNILSFAIPGLDSEAVMVATKDLVAMSNGSACTSSRYEASHVLKAMALDPDLIAGTIRLSWTHETPSIPWGELIVRLDDIRL
ncbi:MAG TPA: aminotransferase class V-fold PLP-dependent enzyme [Allosphingosinicella sp.]|nr:aminotransferase class V-fold PLP-dependent enzyme [Allosphingosinicella sp.]